MLGWELPPHNSGGLGVACYNLGKSLSGLGADIDFVVPYSARHDDIDFMNVICATDLDPLFRYGCGAYVNSVKEIIPRAGAPSTNLREIQETYLNFVKNYLETHKTDIIHAHDWLTFEAGIYAKTHFGIPLVVHVHATEFDRSGMHYGNALIHSIEKSGLEKADHIFAVSNITKNLIVEKYNISPSKISVAYNSLDTSFLPPLEKDSNLPYLYQKKSEGYIIISTVGRFTIQKGLAHLMHAAKLAIEKNKKLFFVFAGDGEDKSTLIEMAVKYGILDNVIFTGFIRGRELSEIYSVSDIFVMSSISEPFGLTALEAAHFGDVLILTKESGVSEILSSAIKYNYWDESALAEQILSVASSDALRASLKSSLKSEYISITWDLVAEKIKSIYDKLIS